jgi:hypothetical protein
MGELYAAQTPTIETECLGTSEVIGKHDQEGRRTSLSRPTGGKRQINRNGEMI